MVLEYDFARPAPLSGSGTGVFQAGSRRENAADAENYIRADDIYSCLDTGHGRRTLCRGTAEGVGKSVYAMRRTWRGDRPLGVIEPVASSLLPWRSPPSGGSGGPICGGLVV